MSGRPAPARVVESFVRAAESVGAHVVLCDFVSLRSALADATTPPTASNVAIARGNGSGADASIVVSRSHVGVAETGSVVLAQESRRHRIDHLLASRHVVVLSERAIVPSLDLAMHKVAQKVRRGCRYLTFVSGPSRTADIEKILTIGAHGPRELVIVLVLRGKMTGD